MRVAVQKLEGVESVDVSLQQKTAVIGLRAANRITLSDLRDVIKDAGFNAREASVTVVGTLVERGGKPALEIGGLKTVLLLASSPGKPDAYNDTAKRVHALETGQVEITGVINPPANASQPEELIVHAVASPR